MPSPREKHHGGETSRKSSDSSKSENKIKTPPGSCTPGSPVNSASPISDDTCPICLGNITDKCMANSCHHCFCLVCLKEWSKQKAVCPLCKESFTTIMYDIQSETEFKIWKVPRFEQSQPLTDFQAFFASGRRFFGYRTTNFPGAATLRHQGGATPITDAIPSGPRERSSAPYRLRGSSFFRLNIYLNNEWVQPIPDITGRYRQSSPELYREQPALTHRLVPWVNRELAALVPSARIGVVLTEVMDLIERHLINSREFRRAMRPHLGSRTNHFVHEFYHFARSPYDMVGHDNAARYVRRYDVTLADSSESSSSEDSDAVVEVDMQGNPVSSGFSSGYQQGSAAPDSIEREEILTQEGSVLISSDESSNNETPQQSNLFVQGPLLQPSLDNTSNPEPNRSSAITATLLVRARNLLSSVNDGASTSLAEGNAATSSSAKKNLKREVPSDSEDSDACMIIEEVRKRQPTPEIITLESEEEETCRSPSSKNNKFAKKNVVHSTNQDRGGPSNSHTHQEKKGKKKPSLNRKNFPVSLGHTKTSDSSKQLRKDHSYCSERESEEILRCKVRERLDRLPSEVHQPAKPLQTYKDKHRSLVISSDSEVGFQSQQQKRIKHREKKHKTRKTVNALNYESFNQDGCSSSSWHDLNSPARKPRKDHKSKIKNSSHTLHQTSYQKHTYDPYHSVSETSTNSWCNSDIIGTPSSTSMSESSSRDSHWQDESSSEYSSSLKNVHKKERKDKHSSSKPKYLHRNRKHKKKDKHRDKSKKEKKRKHKKKYKNRKNVSSSSLDSESSSESSDKRITRHKRKSRFEDSSDLISVSQSHKRKFRRIEYCSSE